MSAPTSPASPATQATQATVTIAMVAQRLRVLPGRLVVEAVPPEETSAAQGTWRVLVGAPEGLTRVREAAPGEGDHWVALYSDETAHDLDTPGMTVSVLAPLAAAGCPVFVASTAAADLVLVPADDLPRAVAALRTAGHTVTG